MASYAKGEAPRDADYAKGGATLGRARDFLKEHVEFRDPSEGKRQSPDVVGDTADADQKYGKTGAGKGNGMCAAPKAKADKCLPVIKPRS
jgi:hypothetical protein